MFIVFEGLDGSGSSTQSKLLADKLTEAGKSALLTKEPTNETPIGKLIRGALQHQWEASPEGLQLLFAADRAEHLKDEIEPALADGKVVISDRYLLSTLAYGSLNVDLEWLKELNKHFRTPDLTFLFKLDPEICIERIQGRGQDFELFEKKEMLEKVWQGYEAAAQHYENVHIIDASRSIEEIGEEVWQVIEGQS